MEVTHRYLSELVVEFDFDVTGVSFTHLLKYLKVAGVPILDLQNTQDSTTVFLTKPTSNQKIHDLLLEYVSQPHESQSKELEIPVCYDDQYASDLSSICNILKLEPQQIIKQHQSSTYTVAMFGFIPGFAYLEGLSKSLYIDRKDTPVKKLHEGSVAIAAHYSAVYPVEAPGGWHVIGRTPLKVVNWLSKNPFLISSDSSIRFVSISSEEFQSHVN